MEADRAARYRFSTSAGLGPNAYRVSYAAVSLGVVRMSTGPEHVGRPWGFECHVDGEIIGRCAAGYETRTQAANALWEYHRKKLEELGRDR